MRGTFDRNNFKKAVIVLGTVFGYDTIARVIWMETQISFDRDMKKFFEKVTVDCR